jgi:hypothetical protein
VGLTYRRAVRDLKPKGVFKICASDVRLCVEPLHFAQDESEHAEIQGVPVYQQDEERAIAIARHLARKAERCPVGGPET